MIGSNPNATTNVATAFGYRAWGMPRTVDYGNSTRLTADYNTQRQQLANYKVQQIGSGSVLFQRYYDYYENGINNGKVRRMGDDANLNANSRRFVYVGVVLGWLAQDCPASCPLAVARRGRLLGQA